MGVGNELGQKLGHRQVGIPVVNIEGGDGQPHNRTEDVTAYELKGTALNEAQREAKEVVDGEARKIETLATTLGLRQRSEGHS